MSSHIKEEDLISAWDEGLSRDAAAKKFGVTFYHIDNHWKRLKKSGLLKPRQIRTAQQDHLIEESLDGRARIGIHDMLLEQLMEHHPEKNKAVSTTLKRKNQND